MKCPKCGAASKVIDSRCPENTCVRQRECMECGYKFRTTENLRADFKKHVENSDFVVTMTNEEKMGFLLNYSKLERGIERQEKELEKWRKRASNIAPISSDPGQWGAKAVVIPDTQMSISYALSKIDLIKMEIASSINVLYVAREKISEAIRHLDDNRLQTLLAYLYIDGLTLKEAASKMHYEYTWAGKLRKKAIGMLKL